MPTHFRVGEAIWHMDGLQGIYEHVHDPDVSTETCSTDAHNTSAQNRLQRLD